VRGLLRIELYITFRNTLLTSYSTVDIIKNISIHQVLFVIILRKDGNKLPGVTASHQSSNDTEYSRSDSKYT